MQIYEKKKNENKHLARRSYICPCDLYGECVGASKNDFALARIRKWVERRFLLMQREAGWIYAVISTAVCLRSCVNRNPFEELRKGSRCGYDDDDDDDDGGEQTSAG